MANVWEKAISILAGNLNLCHSYLITAVPKIGNTMLYYGMAIGTEQIGNFIVSLCLYGGHSKVVVTFHLCTENIGRYFTHLKVLTKAFMLLLFCDEKLLQWSTDARLEIGGGFYRCATIVLWHSTVFGRVTLERRSALVMWSKLYILSTLNIDFMLWNTHLIVCAVNC